jgi:hypothetical protein
VSKAADNAKPCRPRPAGGGAGAGLERPVAARFDPAGDALYIVDFGVMTLGAKPPEPPAGTGLLWGVTRGGGVS